MVNSRARTLSIVVSSLLLAIPIIAEEPETTDPWAPVRVLFGEWQGSGSGFGEEKDSYRLVLELASPGKDFFECQTMNMERVTGE